MIVWGGYGAAGEVDTGAIYDPATDQWRPTTQDGAPLMRSLHTAVWTGSAMLIWGGGVICPNALPVRPVLRPGPELLVRPGSVSGARR